MARFTIRNVDDKTKERLRKQADSNGYSISEEVIVILREALFPVEGKVKRELQGN